MLTQLSTIRKVALVTGSVLVVIIFFGAFYGREMQEAFRGSVSFIPLFGSILGLSLATIMHFGIRNDKELLSYQPKVPLQALICFALVLLVLSAITVTSLSRFPIEKIHFFQFSALSFLAFFALPNHLTLTQRTVLAFVISGGISSAEEALQYFIPRRFFDPLDVLVNLWSSLVGASIAVVFLSLSILFSKKPL